jgi:hypothetical protein
MSNADSKLYVRPRVLRFGKADGEKLDEQLAALDINTSMRTINNVEDLFLRPDGSTANDFRYTAIGFSQIASAIAPGLSKLVPDVAGCFRKPVQELERFDLGVAVGVFNAVLALRFDVLKRQKLVCNVATQQIEGLSGPRRVAISNREMLEATNDAIAEQGRVVFYAAELIGRRLTLWYRSIAPSFEFTVRGDKHIFWHGYYFCNSEAGGTGLRGTGALFNKRGCCLVPLCSKSRLSHLGQRFRQRASQLFQRVAEMPLPAQRDRAHIQKLLDTPLRVVGEAAAREQQMLKITHALCRTRRLTKFIAQDVVETALAVGADNGPLSDVAMLATDPFKHRTAYDLFCALLTRSRQLNLERRELVEQTAHDLMVGKIKIGDK